MKHMRLLAFALTGLGVIPWLAYATFYTSALDAHAYFLAQPGSLYDGAWGSWDAYVYSPAFSQAIEPLRWLGWDGFRTVWRLLDIGVLAVLTGPFTGPLLYVWPVSLEFNLGNIHLLMAGAIVAGFRWPAAWSFVLLTKVTPGIGLLWFVVRREWRNLGIALGVTAAIIAVSFALTPGDWFLWLGSLGDQRQPEGAFAVITAPLLLRLPAAAILVTWGALTNRRWTVLAAGFLALPSVWEHGLAMLVGLWSLRRSAPAPDDDEVRAERSWAGVGVVVRAVRGV